MASAGRLDRRVRLERRNEVADAYGNVTTGWTVLGTVWARLDHKPGREAMAAGRMESAAAATLWIRDSAFARGLSAADKAVIDGHEYAIREVRPPARSGVIELAVERGVAP